LRLEAGQFQTLDGKPEQLSADFGAANCRPLCADFNGDGRPELALFFDGRWLIDLNGNGTWGQRRPGSCSWAARAISRSSATGTATARPTSVVFGRAPFERSGSALVVEAGPARCGQRHGRPASETCRCATRRLVCGPCNSRRRAPSAPTRSDHVFQFGSEGDPGRERLIGTATASTASASSGTAAGCSDVDGDGRFGPGDAHVRIGGRPQACPLLATSTAMAVDEVGTFVGGRWHLDTNGDRVLDQRDTVVQLGRRGRPNRIVGDFADTGSDAIGVYRTTRPTDRDPNALSVVLECRPWLVAARGTRIFRPASVFRVRRRRWRSRARGRWRFFRLVHLLLDAGELLPAASGDACCSTSILCLGLLVHDAALVGVRGRFGNERGYLLRLGLRSARHRSQHAGETHDEECRASDSPRARSGRFLRSFCAAALRPVSKLARKKITSASRNLMPNTRVVVGPRQVVGLDGHDEV